MWLAVGDPQVLFLRKSSPRASVKCRFGPLSAGFDLFDLYYFLKCRFGCLSAGLANDPLVDPLEYGHAFFNSDERNN